MYFCWWGGRTNPRAHFMFVFMEYLKASSLPQPLQCSPFRVNTQTKQKALLSSLKKRGKTQQLCLSSSSTSEYSPKSTTVSPVCRYNANTVFFSLPSPFFLGFCETCYLLGEVNQLFFVGSLQKPQVIKKALIRSHTSTRPWLRVKDSFLERWGFYYVDWKILYCQFNHLFSDCFIQNLLMEVTKNY